ncbi:hypothetical protein LRS74_32445 [Streptomyces sp. LX-29]|uniref:trypsin-like serine peptidase n=1 Tax=Streptomyces sp. LX-29 TaxID=2900152 RepID=UPI00240E43C2|nr:hypothetical protein [Streptomyces sp. LX-29]WFB11222.1 hypothetical protein LRS74_32445 [Streptomyces sp. LX-29]
MRSIRLAVLPLATAAILALTGPATAWATPDPTDPVPPLETTASPAPRMANGEVIDSPTAAEALQRYWTPERMKNAIPLDRVDMAPGASGQSAKAESTPPADARQGSTDASAPPAAAEPQREAKPKPKPQEKGQAKPQAKPKTQKQGQAKPQAQAKPKTQKQEQAKPQAQAKPKTQKQDQAKPQAQAKPKTQKQDQAKPQAQAQAAAQLTESAAVGKVFFTDPGDGLDYVCSASALSSPSRQMLITAGHCVHQGGGGTWMTNWTYAPRYREGVTPFGLFSAQQFRTFDAWINDSDLRRDVAVVTTFTLNGSKVVDVTGGHGLSWNFPTDQAITILGYPGNFSDGEVQSWCTGVTRPVTDGRREMQCNFGGGSSGGPWLRDYNPLTGLGSVNGVMSTLATDGWNRTPYFDDAVKAMVDAQGSVT